MKKRILFLMIIVSSLFCVFPKGKSDSKNKDVVVEGIVVCYGNEPFLFAGITTKDGKKYYVIADDDVKLELLKLQGKEIQFKGKIVKDGEIIPYLEDGSFQIESYKVK